MLSHYVEERYAADLIASDTRGFGYLLKDRVADVSSFLDAVAVISGGGTVLDPEVVSQILVRSRRRSALESSRHASGRYSSSWPREGPTRPCRRAARLGRLGQEAHRLDLREVQSWPRRQREPSCWRSCALES